MKAELDLSPRRIGELGRFIGDFRRYAGRAGLKALLLVFAGALLEGVGLVMLVPLFTLIIGPGDGGGLVGRMTEGLFDALPATGTAGRLAIVFALFALLMAARSLVLLRRDLVIARLLVGFVQDRRSRIVRRLAGSRWDHVSHLRHGRVTHVLSSDVQSVRMAANFLLQCTVAAAMLVFQTAFAVLISPPLAIVILVLLAALGPALWPVLQRSRRAGTALTAAHLDMADGTTQFLGGLKLALSQNLQNDFVDEFEATQTRALEQELAFARQQSLTQIALTLFMVVVGALVVMIDVTLIGTSPPALIALLVILARTSGPAAQLQNGAQHIFHSLPAYAQIRRLEDELAPARRIDRPDRAPATGAPPRDASVEFRNVSYRHPGRSDHPDGPRGGVFEISLRISDGEWIGVTGPSGAGKTTFADLLSGLYPPGAGEIEVGGEALDDRRLDTWRGAISYVSQDPFLFHDSLRANLLWARADAGEDELREMLALVGADRLVRDLPNGLETVVGERGSLLSGGERQRFALARALLRRPKLLLLDEATSAIDVAAEARILDGIRQLDGQPTTILIAHREASFAYADRIIAFEAGRIASDRRA